MGIFQRLRQKARLLKTDILALWFAYRDSRTPWYAKLWAAMVVGYAFSPIDLIPDFIPVLGYLDDVILLPLGIMFAIRLIPEEVLADSITLVDSVADAKPASIDEAELSLAIAVK